MRTTGIITADHRGEKLYNTEGTNTCVYCHGKGGHGSNQAGAADLRHPKTWRSYQALGGDAAYTADKEKFLKEMETVLHYLIAEGATVWNLKFPRAHKDLEMDWSKVTVPDKADRGSRRYRRKIYGKPT